MKILYVASEVAPFAKTGGLGDVSAALPRQLHENGHEVLLVVPLYGRVQRSGAKLEPIPGAQHLSMRIGPHTVLYDLYRAKLPGTSLDVVFVRQSKLYDRDGIYTQDADEHMRFIALNYAALSACQHLGFSPDIAHVHDWQTALLPLVMKTRFGWDTARFGRTKTILTIHNLGHQGRFGSHILPDTGLADSTHLFHKEQLEAGVINMMLTGILYADAVTTVSPTYAREIQTPEVGMELDPFLRARSGTVIGILNGIDPDEWSPERDVHISHRYSSANIPHKEHNKKSLLESLGLRYVPGVPVLGLVSRLVYQKGLELVLEALPPLLAHGQVQLVVLGSGATRYEQGFAALESHFRGRVCFYRGFSNELAHRIEAGADLFLMPSRFEPCGLNQMYSLAYGTPPIVRRTGGLADSVQPYDAGTGEGTGFVFDHFSTEGLSWAIRQALHTYQNRAAWRQLQHNGMAQDFSWARRVGTYEALYQRVLDL